MSSSSSNAGNALPRPNQSEAASSKSNKKQSRQSPDTSPFKFVTNIFPSQASLTRAQRKALLTESLKNQTGWLFKGPTRPLSLGLEARIKHVQSLLQLQNFASTSTRLSLELRTDYAAQGKNVLKQCVLVSQEYGLFHYPRGGDWRDAPIYWSDQLYPLRSLMSQCIALVIQDDQVEMKSAACPCCLVPVPSDLSPKDALKNSHLISAFVLKTLFDRYNKEARWNFMGRLKQNLDMTAPLLCSEVMYHDCDTKVLGNPIEDKFARSSFFQQYSQQVTGRQQWMQQATVGAPGIDPKQLQADICCGEWDMLGVAGATVPGDSSLFGFIVTCMIRMAYFSSVSWCRIRHLCDGMFPLLDVWRQFLLKPSRPLPPAFRLIALPYPDVFQFLRRSPLRELDPTQPDGFGQRYVPYLDQSILDQLKDDKGQPLYTPEQQRLMLTDRSFQETACGAVGMSLLSTFTMGFMFDQEWQFAVLNTRTGTATPSGRTTTHPTFMQFFPPFIFLAYMETKEVPSFLYATLRAFEIHPNQPTPLTIRLTDEDEHMLPRQWVHNALRKVVDGFFERHMVEYVNFWLQTEKDKKTGQKK